VLAALLAGATEIVATDVGEFALRSALKSGADRAINVATDPEALRASAADKGHFDVLFEASGNAAALRAALDVVRPRGIVVQLGLGGDMELPINAIVAKELELRGTFRFHEEFGIAVELLNKGLVDVKPLISATVPFRDAGRAFALAADRSQAMKVLLDFEAA
jgi:L-idonate 5-dehydrogenase